MSRKWILVVSIILLAFLSISCLTIDEEDVIIGDEPQVSPTGVGRNHPDAIEEFGCPDKDKVPVWQEIPECQ